MQLNTQGFISINDEESLNNFLKDNNYSFADFKNMQVDNVFERFHGIKENQGFLHYPIIVAIKNSNEFLINKLLSSEDPFKTNFGFYIGSYHNIKNNISFKKLLSENSFYQAYSEQEMASLFNVINDKILNPYSENNLKFESPFQSESFLKYGLPIVLKYRYENILQYMLIPLLNKFDDSAISMMKNNNWEDIDFLFKTIKKNKKDLFDHIYNTGKAYNKEKIIKILKDGYTALFAFLNPNALYEGITSATKNNQTVFVEKMNNLLDLTDRLSPHAKTNILYESEQNSLKLELNNPKSYKKFKNTPLALSIDKELNEITSCFLNHGYEMNNIENKYIELKKIYKGDVGVDSTNEIYNKFITIAHTKNKTSYKKLTVLLDSLEDLEKQKLFEKIKLETIEKEKKSPSYYDLSFSEKSIREDSEKYSVISYMILNNHIEMTLKMLEEGYKLSKAEYGLIVVSLSKLTVAPLDNENLPVEIINYKILNLLKDYPSNYKKTFMLNVIEREIEKSKKNKSLNRAIDFYAYSLINDEKLDFNEIEKNSLKFKFKNKLLSPLIMSWVLMNSESIDPSLDKKTIDIDNYISRLKISIILTLPFFRDNNVKDNYLEKIEGLLSKTEDVYPESKSLFENINDSVFRSIYANSLAKKEKNIIISNLSKESEFNNNNNNNNNKRRL